MIEGMSETASHEKTSVLNRCLAKSIDICVVIFLNTVFPHVVGALMGFLYMLVEDGLFAGQSLGKRMLKLKVIHVKDGLPCTYRESAIRNAPVGVATFFAIIPFWGWILAVLVGIPLIIFEIYLMMSREMGLRLGDVMADTLVIDIDPRKRK